MTGARPTRVPLPREHGAWAMFVVPVLVGIGTAGIINTPVLVFALTAFGFFLVRYPLMLAVKSRAPQARSEALRWSLIYGLSTFIAGAVLMVMSRQWLLIPIAAAGFLSLAVYLLGAARRAEMTTLGEWIGIAGLALGAPGAYLVATGRLDLTALMLYLLNVLFFGGTIFYIKFKAREQPRFSKSAVTWPTRLWAGRVTIAYHALVVLVVALFATIGLVPALAVVAFVPVMCKAVGGVISQPARLNMKHLGFIELGFTVAFALVILIAYR